MTQKFTTVREVRNYALAQVKANAKPGSIATMKAYEVAAGQAARYMFPEDFSGLKIRFATWKNSIVPESERVMHELSEMM